jgi:hypothetical protein
MSEQRQLSQEEIKAIEKTEELADQVGGFILELEKNGYVDKRWLAIAKTDLQKAFMSLRRSINKPNHF